MDNDMSGGKIGATYDYGFRIYDSRIAKFLSVDPLTGSYPWYTPYQFAGNTPIQALDLDGIEILNYKSRFVIKFKPQLDKNKASYTLWEGNHQLTRTLNVLGTYSTGIPSQTKNNTIVLKDEDYPLPNSKNERDLETGKHLRNPNLRDRGQLKYRGLKGDAMSDATEMVMESLDGIQTQYKSYGDIDLANEYIASELSYSAVMDYVSVVEDEFSKIIMSSEFSDAVKLGKANNITQDCFTSDVMNFVKDGSNDARGFTSIGFSNDFSNYKSKVYMAGMRILDKAKLNLKLEKKQTLLNAIYEGSWLYHWIQGPPKNNK